MKSVKYLRTIPAVSRCTTTYLQSALCSTKIQEISASESAETPITQKRKKSKPRSMQRQFYDFLIESTPIGTSPQTNDNHNLSSETNSDEIDYEIDHHSLSQLPIIDPLQHTVHCPEVSRFGKVSIIGMPNAGKSSLLNRIINHPLSAISSKVNTTRQQTIGCLTHSNIQIEFIDTPGILPLSLFHPQRDKKQHTLHYEAWSAVYKSDIIIMIIDPTKKSQNKNILIAQQLATLRNKTQSNSDNDKLILVINKCDLFWPHTKLHELAEALNNECRFDLTLIVSAKHKRRIDKLKGYLLSHIGSEVNQKSKERYCRKWKFESFVKSDMSQSEEILECIRGKIYQRTHQEVPYNVELEMENISDDGENGKMYVDVVINVKKRSHQNLLNGSAKGYIKRWAARDLTKRYGKEVVLNIKVAMTI